MYRHLHAVARTPDTGRLVAGTGPAPHLYQHQHLSPHHSVNTGETHTNYKLYKKYLHSFAHTYNLTGAMSIFKV